ncbi:MAG: methyltransferase [Treponema sp.]|jgi:tRNA G10  N-methylase Trm11|nr:methyltransferase [Treponema sp.]
MIYYASFVPGMQETVKEIILERLRGASIVKLLDGAVVFDTPCTYDKLNFHCFNNIFMVISIMEHAVEAQGRESPLEAHMKKAATARSSPVISENNGKIKTFRIFCSFENKPAAISETLRQETERFIARESGLKVNRSAPDTEFWFLYRNEGFSVFMKRLTRHASFEKQLHPGELTPQLAWFLCKLSEPKHTDVAVDPFCGYGSIPEQRTKHFPFKKMYAFDIDNRALKITREKLKGKSAGICEVIPVNIDSVFEYIPKGSVDAVITDPPWGLYKETNIPLQQFYDNMIAVFAGLLKTGCLAVALTAKNEELRLAAEKTPELPIIRTIPILVSGKKAAVFVMKKQ